VLPCCRYPLPSPHKLLHRSQHGIGNATLPLVTIILVILVVAALLLQVHEFTAHVSKKAPHVVHSKLCEAAAGDVSSFELVGMVLTL
jgi:hypothetical protein